MAAAYVRAEGDDTFVVCLNAGDDAAAIEVRVPDLDGRTLSPVTPPGWAWAPGDPIAVTDGRAWIELQRGRAARTRAARRALIAIP